MNRLFTSLLFTAGILFSSQGLHAQVQPGDALYEEIMQADSLLFEAGFNNCDLQVLEQIMDSSLEFYHDLSGITAGKEAYIEGIRNNICSIDYKPERKLVEVEIFPLKSNGEIYGAIQKGVHEFYAIEKGQSSYLTSTAKFTNLWIKKDQQWILRNVLSYDHQSPEQSEKVVKQEYGEIESWMNEHHVPALGVALIKNNKLTSVSVKGELYANKAAPYNTLFNVASLTKPILTMLTLKLVDNGDWKLDEPLAQYWTDPDVKNDPNSQLITTRHILSHQSGFKNWRWENEDNKLVFGFEPGTSFRYSGEGFEYLQHALENKFDQPLDVLADSLIFTPLGMEDTRFYWDEKVEEERFAKWHDKNGKQVYETYKNTSASAADNLLTTVEDYGKFARFVLNGGGISQKLFEEMLSRQNGEENGVVMGLGWEMLPNLKNDEYAFLHTGGDKGVHTLVMLLPKTGEGIVIFTNGDNGNQLYFRLIEEYLSLGKYITGKAQS